MPNKQHMNELLSICPVEEWKDWLFNLQCILIENGYVEGLTETGRSDFAARMQGLYEHFRKVSPVTEG